MHDENYSLPRSGSDCKLQLNSTHFNSHIAPPLPHPPSARALPARRTPSETPSPKTRTACREPPLEEINIYGRVYEVDYRDRASVERFLGEVEGSARLGEATKTSIQWVVVQRAVRRNCSLQDLLEAAAARYEKRLLSSIFN